jgi:uridine kinase
MVCGDGLGHPTRVAVDGITASGKTTFARELATAVEALGRPAIHLTMDGYHHPRQHRYRQGRQSAVGYYEDAYDFEAFLNNVLIPLGPGGDHRYRERIIDLAADEAVDELRKQAPITAVLIVDGSFLQRPEIASHWDHRIFINTSFEVALDRGIAREAPLLGGVDIARTAYEDRYHAAARLYIDSVHPAERATIVVDNDDPDNPRLRTPRHVAG